MQTLGKALLSSKHMKLVQQQKEWVWMLSWNAATVQRVRKTEMQSTYSGGSSLHVLKHT